MFPHHRGGQSSHRASGVQFQSSSARKRKSPAFDVDEDEEEDSKDGFAQSAMKKKKSVVTTVVDDGDSEAPEGKYVKYGDRLGRPDRPDRPKRPKLTATTAASWAPSSFTSSRGDRVNQGESAPRKAQHSSVPQDFMDDEDLEAFGYAAGMKTKLPFASLQGGGPAAQHQHQHSADSSFGLLMRTSLHEQLVTASQGSIGLVFFLSLQTCFLYDPPLFFSSSS